ncbi:MAG: 16S rRNA (guanine(527)-N(7))-methyltransferase RsmG, partial [Alphaproteobacteria bacterium]|nr:16S rRNA (guanine(527)-N(7))-methyltransferase RsmG [Alphaproteobacteria bacterium]
FGPSDLQRAISVSRETLDRLEILVDFLRAQNAIHNLVSARSLEAVWQRHVLDSAQLDRLLPEGPRTLADLGSGAGFPGLVLAAMRPHTLKVTLYEATGKKCEFLRQAASRMTLPVEVHRGRIEDAPQRGFDIVTARACAPLPPLLGYAQRFTRKGTICLFLKGLNVVDELTKARQCWTFEAHCHASLSDSTGRILELRKVANRD